MPTYEYRCPKGHRFEKFFPQISSKRSAACPECGARAQRLISGGAGLVFKGSGFYVTDYKRGGAAKPSEGDGKAPEPAKPAEGTKPAATGESGKRERKQKKDAASGDS
jgi:putative FmdB family regulatory protein